MSSFCHYIRKCLPLNFKFYRAGAESPENSRYALTSLARKRVLTVLGNLFHQFSRYSSIFCFKIFIPSKNTVNLCNSPHILLDSCRTLLFVNQKSLKLSQRSPCHAFFHKSVPPLLWFFFSISKVSLIYSYCTVYQTKKTRPFS